MIGLLTAVTIMGMPASAFAADLETQKLKSEVVEDTFQICYISKQSDIIFRMGQEINDIGGDYNNYNTNNIVNINGSNVKLKGDDKLIKVAAWSVNNMSYSISVNDGMKQDDIINIIKSTF